MNSNRLVSRIDLRLNRVPCGPVRSALVPDESDGHAQLGRVGQRLPPKLQQHGLGHDEAARHSLDAAHAANKASGDAVSTTE